MAPRTKALLVNSLRFAVAGGILAFLVWRYRGDVAQVAAQPKDWGLFLTAVVLVGLAALLTFVRWYLLVWAQGLPFRVADALRLGFLGYVFNFVAPGLVGGDLFKAVFVAREQQRRTVAVATVVLDRFIGLLALFCVGAVAAATFWSQLAPRPELRQLAYWLWGLSGAGVAGTVLVFSPLVYRLQWLKQTIAWPVVGGMLAELYRAVGTYHERRRIVFIAWAMSLVGHAGFIVAFHLVAAALAGWHPTLGEHLVIYPLAVLVGAVVPVPAGMGAAEGVFAVLYGLVAPTGILLGEAQARGLATALGYRVVTLAIAAVGGVIYLARRREIARVLREAQRSVAQAAPASRPDAGAAEEPEGVLESQPSRPDVRPAPAEGSEP